MRVVLSKAARRDLRAIALYIAERTPGRAHGFVADIEARCRSIGEFPEAARHVERLGTSFRMFPYRGYIILYRIGATDVSIERIWHGARNIGALIDNIFDEG
jgi:toxin ParE1/3/4